MKLKLLPLLYLLLSLSTQIVLHASTASFSRVSDSKGNPIKLNISGDVALIGNSVLQSQSGAPKLNTNNNNIDAVYVDLDSDGSTFNSTNAELKFSESLEDNNVEIVWAGLYWQGRFRFNSGDFSINSSTSQAKTIKIRRPGATTYESVTADDSKFYDLDEGSRYNYQSFADVTDIVRAGKSGTYWVADLPTRAGGKNLFGAWSLMVVYRDIGTPKKLPLKHISVYDGYLEIFSNSESITLTDFFTPTNGTVNANLFVFSGEGDSNFDGDQLRLSSNNTDTNLDSSDAVFDSLNTNTNVFNSTVSNSGRYVTSRNPAFQNTIGIDIDVFNVGTNGLNKIGNRRSRAVIELTSTGDQYFPGLVAFTADLYEPDICYSESISLVEGSATTPIIEDGSLASNPPNVDVGDTLEVTVNVTNRNAETAEGVTVVRDFDSFYTYTSDSMFINSLAQTDQAGDDQAVNTDGAQSTFYLGNGASPSAGGTIQQDEITTIRYRFKIDQYHVEKNGKITNDYTVKYTNSDIGINIESQMNTCDANVDEITVVPPADVCYVQEFFRYKSGTTVQESISNTNNAVDSSTQLEQNDRLVYKVTIRNTGFSNLSKFQLTKSFDDGTLGLAADITDTDIMYIDLDSSPNQTFDSGEAKTLASGDDSAAYESSTNLVTMNLGSGADSAPSGFGGTIGSEENNSLAFITTIQTSVIENYKPEIEVTYVNADEPGAVAIGDISACPGTEQALTISTPKICYTQEAFRYDGNINSTLSGSPLQSGDTISTLDDILYKITLRNDALRTVSEFTYEKQFDTQLGYVTSDNNTSLYIDDPNDNVINYVGYSDSNDDDLATYLGETNNTVLFHIGEGATGTGSGEGGLLKADQNISLAYVTRFIGTAETAYLNEPSVSYRVPGSTNEEARGVIELCDDAVVASLVPDAPAGICYLQEIYRFDQSQSLESNFIEENLVLSDESNVSRNQVTVGDTLLFKIIVLNFDQVASSQAVTTEDIEELVVKKDFRDDSDSVVDYVERNNTNGEYSMFIDEIITDSDVSASAFISQTDANDSDFAMYGINDTNTSTFHLGEGATPTESGTGGTVSSEQNASFMYLAKIINLPNENNSTDNNYTNIFTVRYKFQNEDEFREGNISSCTGETFSIEILPSGKFLIVDRGGTCSNPVITTKRVNENMNFSMIACDDYGNEVTLSSSEKIKYALYNEGNEMVDFGTDSDTFTYSAGNGAQDMSSLLHSLAQNIVSFKTEPADGNSSYEDGISDQFAIIPDRFDIEANISNTNLAYTGANQEVNISAGTDFNISFIALDVSGNRVTNFGNSATGDLDGDVDLNVTYERANANMDENGTFTLDGTTVMHTPWATPTPPFSGTMLPRFENGQASFTANYSEVGAIGVLIHDDVTFAAIDINDTAEADRTIAGATADFGRFRPDRFNVTIQTSDLENNSSGFTYLSNDQNDMNMSAFMSDVNITIQALNTNGDVTQNYENDFDKDITVVTTLTTAEQQGMSHFTSSLGDWNFTSETRNFTNGELNLSAPANTVALRMNYRRDHRTPVEPFNVVPADMTLHSEVNDTDGVSGVTNPDANPSGGTLTYMYGRLNPIDGKTVSSLATVNSSLYYEVYCKTCTKSSFGMDDWNRSINDTYWWQNPWNTVRIPDNNITGDNVNITNTIFTNHMQTRTFANPLNNTRTVRMTIDLGDYPYLYHNPYRDSLKNYFFLDFRVIADPGGSDVAENEGSQTFGGSRISE